MPSTYTSRFRLEKIGNGEKSGSWGTTENGTRDLLEIAIAGYLEIAMGDANVTLTTANGSTDQARYHILKMTGTNTATRDVIAPALSRTYVIENGTTQSIRIKTSTGAAVTIPTGLTAFVFCDGTDFALASAYSTTNIDILNSVTPAADRMLYFTSSSAGALATLTSFGRSLIDDADASAGRTTLGLGSLATASTINNSNWSGTALAVGNGGTGSNTAADARTALGLAIGTNVQAYNANLGQVAGLSIVADTLPYGNGAGTLALTTLSAFARTLLDDADAATARATLGVTDGGTALQAANNLSDVNSAASSRTNLGVTATGSDTTYAYRANNLSDLASASSARTNLGLGTAAVVNTGTSGATIPLLNGANTWSNAQVVTGSIRYGDGGLIIRTASAASTSSAYFQTSDGVTRYVLGINDTDDGLFINRFDAAGAYQDTPFGISSAGVLYRAGYQIADENNTVTLSNKTISSPTLSGTVAGSPTASGDWTFASRVTISGTAPDLWMVDTNGGTNATIWRNYAYTNGSLGWSLVNDAISVENFWLTVTRTAHTAATVDFGSIVTLNHNGVKIPTISSTDTLTNKTISSPTLSGTVAGSPTASGDWTFAGGHQRMTRVSGSTGPGSSGSSTTDIILRVGASNVGAAGYGLDIGTSNATGQVWMQARDWNSYATNVAINLNPNGGGATLGGVAIPTISSTDTLTNKTLSSPTLSGTVAGAASWSGIQTLQQQVNIGSGVASGGVPFHLENSTVTNNKMGAYFQGTGTAFTFVPYDGGSYSTSDEFGYDFTSNVWFFDSATVNLAGSPIVSRSATETLSNKTLSSPTLSGTVAGSPSASGSWTFTTGDVTLTSGGFVVGGGTDAAGLTGFQGISVKTTGVGAGIRVRRDGYTEIGIVSGGSSGLGTFSNHDLNIFTNSAVTATFVAAGGLLIGGKSALSHNGSYTSGKVTFSTSDPSGGSSGDVWFKHAA